MIAGFGHVGVSVRGAVMMIVGVSVIVVVVVRVHMIVVMVMMVMGMRVVKWVMVRVGRGGSQPAPDAYRT